MNANPTAPPKVLRKHQKTIATSNTFSLNSLVYRMKELFHNNWHAVKSIENQFAIFNPGKKIYVR